MIFLSNWAEPASFRAVQSARSEFEEDFPVADTITIVPYFSITVPDRTGAGVQILGALKEAGVSLIGMWGYPIKGKKSRIDFVPVDPKAFAKAAKQLKLEVGPKQNAICWAGEDRHGAAADAASKLAAAGINIFAAQVICSGEGRFGGLIQVAQEDVKKAAKALAK